MNPRPPKPTALPVQPDSIPVGMRARHQWVVWRYEFNPENTKPWTKVPYNPNRSYKASHSDPNTWGSSEEALALYQRGGHDGIGYVFSKDDPYCGIDLDDCRTHVDGEIVPEKRRYVDQMVSYTEVSPSGTGLHIIIEGQLPGGGRKNAKLRIELYDHERFFCFTGHTLNGMPADPQPRQAELEKFYAEIFGPKKTQAESCFESDTSPLTADEQKILDKALANKKNGEKISLLFDGQFEKAGYPSQSEADLALCNLLAFWFNRDPVAIDKVFRTSKLWREKWDKEHYGNGETYGQHTIQKALETVSEGYSGANSKKTTQSPTFEGEPIDILGDPALTGKPEWPGCPRALDTFARDEAERIGVDIAMVAMHAIGVAATAIHDGFRIQPKQKDTQWTEPPILWIGVVGDPGQRKSPAQAAAKRPLQEIEHERHMAHNAAMREYDLEYEVWKKSKTRSAPPEKPVLRRLSVDDTTMEGLRRVLGENPRGVGIIKDELGGFFSSFGAYQNNSNAGSKDRADYCELYQGQPKTFDRAEKGTLYIPHWGASIVGNIQPGPVRRLMGKITDDGLIARFMVAHCEETGQGIDREPDNEAIGIYHHVIKKLAALEPKSKTEIFTFEPQAQKYRDIIFKLAQVMKSSPDASDAFKAHMNKFGGMFCRLALVFHMIVAATAGEYPANQISEDTACMAATLVADFLFPNSIRFYAETIDDGSHNADARKVAGHILARGLVTITKRALTQAYHQFRGNSKPLQATMNTLEAYNWVNEEKHKKSGEVISWAVNPTVHTKFKRLAQIERERRAAEMEKIQQAARMRRKGR